MLSFYTFSSILVLATVVVCQSDQTQPVAEYVINRPSLDPIELGLQDSYEIFLNKHYLRPNGAAEFIPVAESALDVYVKFKSSIDGYSYRIKCPNTFYWPKDTSHGNSFYIDLDLGVPRGQHPKPIEFVDISKICLYQNREHITEERVVKSKNWFQSGSVLKRMCCTDEPLTTVPPAEFQPKKLRSDSLLGDGFDPPGFGEGGPYLPKEPIPIVPGSGTNPQSSNFNFNFNPEKVAMNTDIIEEEPPNHEEDKIPNDAITNDDTFGAESSDQIFKKRGIKSRFQKSRVIRG